MTEDEFWKSNPRKVNLRIKAFNKEQERKYEYDNAIAHINGFYFRDALLSTVGNMFSKNSNFEYPKKPYGQEDIERELTDQEKQVQLDLFVANLQNMKANFELNHPPKTENENNNN